VSEIRSDNTAAAGVPAPGRERAYSVGREKLILFLRTPPPPSPPLLVLLFSATALSAPLFAPPAPLISSFLQYAIAPPAR